jgi:ribosomal-protein-serine acetyltransferase
MNHAISIRPYVDSDVDEQFLAVRESLAELKPWMPWATEAYSLADATSWIETTQEGHHTGALFAFAIVDFQGRHVGACGLSQINSVNRVANLGYWVRSSATGHGIASAAVRQLVAWAFENTPLNRLEIVVAVDNVRSRRVAEKTGAHYDAELEQRLILEGRPTSAVLYSFVRPS